MQSYPVKPKVICADSIVCEDKNVGETSFDSKFTIQPFKEITDEEFINFLDENVNLNVDSVFTLSVKEWMTRLFPVQLFHEMELKTLKELDFDVKLRKHGMYASGIGETNDLITQKMNEWIESMLCEIKTLQNARNKLEARVAALENKELVDNPDNPVDYIVGGDNPDLPLFGGNELK